MANKDINSYQNFRQFKYIDIVTVIFVLVLVVSNIASSAKIIDWGVNLFKIPLAFDAGTILFPISYIFGDILTEVYGFKQSRRIIWIGFGCLIFTALVFWIISIMPGELNWQQTVGQDSFNKILGGLFSGGIVLASILGYLLGSFSNAIVMSLLKKLSQSKFLWIRTISSTIIGEFVDTFIFILIATITRVFPWGIFWSLIITNYIFKVGIEVLMTPFTYLIVNKLKQSEGIEFFDETKDLNPFKF